MGHTFALSAAMLFKPSMRVNGPSRSCTEQRTYAPHEAGRPLSDEAVILDPKSHCPESSISGVRRAWARAAHVPPGAHGLLDHEPGPALWRHALLQERAGILARLEHLGLRGHRAA